MNKPQGNDIVNTLSESEGEDFGRQLHEQEVIIELKKALNGMGHTGSFNTKEREYEQGVDPKI